jgi:hypothetical protein
LEPTFYARSVLELMLPRVMEKNLRNYGLSVLEARYGYVEYVQGQGIPKGSRVSFKEGSESVVCAIKVTTGGRIHFPYSDGSWGALSQVQRVLYVRRLPTNPSAFEAQMHDAKALLKVFERNLEAARAKGVNHLPAWLNADFEPGDRFIGSGFGASALWREVSTESTTATPAKPAAPMSFIDRTKAQLASALGIKPENIEIVIKV